MMHNAIFISAIPMPMPENTVPGTLLMAMTLVGTISSIALHATSSHFILPLIFLSLHIYLLSVDLAE